MRKITISILLGFVAAFIAVVSFYILKIIFYDLYLNNIENIPIGLSIAISAFLGAFMAFIFTIIARELKEFRDREKESYNKLLALGYLLQNCRNTIKRNLAVIREKISTFQEKGFSNELLWVIPSDDNFEIPKLKDEELRRDILVLFDNICALNKTRDDFNALELDFRQLILENKIQDQKSISESFKSLEEFLIKFQKTFLEIDGQIKKVFSTVKQLTRDDKPFIF